MKLISKKTLATVALVVASFGVVFCIGCSHRGSSYTAPPAPQPTESQEDIQAKQRMAKYKMYLDKVTPLLDAYEKCVAEHHDQSCQDIADQMNGLAP